MTAVVEYVLSGHRFKLLVPKDSCTIAFSLSGVRCPGRGEPFSEEAISFMRRKIMQQDVEVRHRPTLRNPCDPFLPPEDPCHCEIRNDVLIKSKSRVSESFWNGWRQ